MLHIKSWWLLLVFTHITKVKQRRARLVSGWVTAQEYWMPKTFQLSPNHNLLDFNAVFGSFWLKHYNLKVFYKFSKSKLSESTGFRTQDSHNLKSETITHYATGAVMLYSVKTLCYCYFLCLYM